MDVDNLRCNECQFYRVNADREESICKRIDHKRVKFAVPWFKSYDCDHGCICSDFIPVEHYPAVYKNWQEIGGFKGRWPLWVEQWLPYKNTDVLTYFTIGKDTSIRYGVHLMDFVNGTMFDGDVLKAVEKMYIKRVKKSDKNPIGYKVIRKSIDGVTVPQ